MAELLYRRLMSVADDYGRFYGSPATIRGACWPTNPNSVTERAVKCWLKELSEGDDPLVIVYGEGRFLQIVNFGQRIQSKSKFPEPLPLNTVKHGESPENNGASRSRISESKAESESIVAEANFEIFWQAYPRKDCGRSEALKSFRKHPKLWTDQMFFQSVMRSLEKFKESQDWNKQGGQFIPQATTWLNQKRWEGEVRNGNNQGNSAKLFSDKTANNAKSIAVGLGLTGDTR
jgi:hypothetical protein